MPKKPIQKTYAGQPQATPMPTHMPVQEASSFTSLQRLPKELMKVNTMDDYPNGRGGMQVVPMAPAEQSAKPAVRAGMPIGPRPPATKMPTNP